MEKFSRNLSIVLTASLLGGALATWLAPKIISVLFTPPVSFGINCEPAAAWSMGKLVASQGLGLILGMTAGIAFSVYLRRRAERKKSLSGGANPFKM